MIGRVRCPSDGDFSSLERTALTRQSFRLPEEQSKRSLAETSSRVQEASSSGGWFFGYGIQAAVGYMAKGESSLPAVEKSRKEISVRCSDSDQFLLFIDAVIPKICDVIAPMLQKSVLVKGVAIMDKAGYLELLKPALYRVFENRAKTLCNGELISSRELVAAIFVPILDEMAKITVYKEEELAKIRAKGAFIGPTEQGLAFSAAESRIGKNVFSFLFPNGLKDLNLGYLARGVNYLAGIEATIAASIADIMHPALGVLDVAGQVPAKGSGPYHQIAKVFEKVVFDALQRNQDGIVDVAVSMARDQVRDENAASGSVTELVKVFVEDGFFSDLASEVTRRFLGQGNEAGIKQTVERMLYLFLNHLVDSSNSSMINEVSRFVEQHKDRIYALSHKAANISLALQFEGGRGSRGGSAVNSLIDGPGSPRRALRAQEQRQAIISEAADLFAPLHQIIMNNSAVKWIPCSTALKVEHYAWPLFRAISPIVELYRGRQRENQALNVKWDQFSSGAAAAVAAASIEPAVSGNDQQALMPPVRLVSFSFIDRLVEGIVAKVRKNLLQDPEFLTELLIEFTVSRLPENERTEAAVKELQETCAFNFKRGLDTQGAREAQDLMEAAVHQIVLRFVEGLFDAYSGRSALELSSDFTELLLLIKPDSEGEINDAQFEAAVTRFIAIIGGEQKFCDLLKEWDVMWRGTIIEQVKNKLLPTAFKLIAKEIFPTHFTGEELPIHVLSPEMVARSELVAYLTEMLPSLFLSSSDKNGVIKDSGLASLILEMGVLPFLGREGSSIEEISSGDWSVLIGFFNALGSSKDHRLYPIIAEHIGDIFLKILAGRDTTAVVETAIVAISTAFSPQLDRDLRLDKVESSRQKAISAESNKPHFTRIANALMGALGIADDSFLGGDVDRKESVSGVLSDEIYYLYDGIESYTTPEALKKTEERYSALIEGKKTLLRDIRDRNRPVPPTAKELYAVAERFAEDMVRMTIDSFENHDSVFFRAVLYPALKAIYSDDHPALKQKVLNLASHTIFKILVSVAEQASIKYGKDNSGEEINDLCLTSKMLMYLQDYYNNRIAAIKGEGEPLVDLLPLADLFGGYNGLEEMLSFLPQKYREAAAGSVLSTAIPSTFKYFKDHFSGIVTEQAALEDESVQGSTIKAFTGVAARMASKAAVEYLRDNPKEAAKACMPLIAERYLKALNKDSSVGNAVLEAHLAKAFQEFGSFGEGSIAGLDSYLQAIFSRAAEAMVKRMDDLESPLEQSDIKPPFRACLIGTFMDLAQRQNQAITSLDLDWWHWHTYQLPLEKKLDALRKEEILQPALDPRVEGSSDPEQKKIDLYYKDVFRVVTYLANVEIEKHIAEGAMPPWVGELCKKELAETLGPEILKNAIKESVNVDVIHHMLLESMGKLRSDTPEVKPAAGPVVAKRVAEQGGEHRSMYWGVLVNMVNLIPTFFHNIPLWDHHKKTEDLVDGIAPEIENAIIDKTMKQVIEDSLNRALKSANDPEGVQKKTRYQREKELFSLIGRSIGEQFWTSKIEEWKREWGEESWLYQFLSSWFVGTMVSILISIVSFLYIQHKAEDVIKTVLDSDVLDNLIMNGIDATLYFMLNPQKAKEDALNQLKWHDAVAAKTHDRYEDRLPFTNNIHKKMMEEFWLASSPVSSPRVVENGTIRAVANDGHSLFRALGTQWYEKVRAMSDQERRRYFVTTVQSQVLLRRNIKIKYADRLKDVEGLPSEIGLLLEQEMDLIFEYYTAIGVNAKQKREALMKEYQDCLAQRNSSTKSALEAGQVSEATSSAVNELMKEFMNVAKTETEVVRQTLELVEELKNLFVDTSKNHLEDPKKSDALVAALRHLACNENLYRQEEEFLDHVREDSTTMKKYLYDMRSMNSKKDGGKFELLALQQQLRIRFTSIEGDQRAQGDPAIISSIHCYLRSHQDGHYDIFEPRVQIISV